MKILFVHHGHERGGAPLSLRILLGELARFGVKSDLVQTTGKSEAICFFQDVCSRVYSFRMWFYPHSSLGWMRLDRCHGIYSNIKWVLLYPWSCLSLLRAIFRGKSYDFVHFNSATLIPYGWIPKIMGIPLFCHIREPFSRGHFGVRRVILRKLLAWFCVHAIAICVDNGNDTMLSEKKHTVVYNPVDFKRFDFANIDPGECRNNLGIPDKAFVCLFAGGANAQVKGASEYLKAMVSLASSIGNLVCLMPNYKSAQMTAENQLNVDRLNESATVIRNGFVQDIEKWIAASDVVYTPHITPHFSRTIMEAGAMKRPVVASDISGIQEIVDNGVNGVLCEPGDVNGIIQATVSLYRNPDLREQMGSFGHSQACRLFESGIHAEKVYACYVKMMKEINKQE